MSSWLYIEPPLCRTDNEYGPSAMMALLRGEVRPARPHACPPSLPWDIPWNIPRNIPWNNPLNIP